MGIGTDENNCEGKLEIVGAEHKLHVERLEGDSEKEISIQQAEARQRVTYSDDLNTIPQDAG